MKNTLTKTLLFLMVLGLSMTGLAADELDDALFGSDTTEESTTDASTEEDNLDSLFGDFGDDDSGSMEDDLFGSSESGSTEDDLFGGSDDLLSDISDNMENPEDLFFADNTGFTIGGKISSKIGLGVDYSNYFDTENVIDDASDYAFAGLNSTMFLSVRPNDEFRFYMKVDTAYPFNANTTVRELFSEFDYEDTVYFRVGKQTVNWGVGYFYSPADVISVESIDITDATAEREGPVAIYANIPFGLNNIDLYTIVPDVTGTTSALSLSDLAFAGKGSMLIGNTEVGLGAFYRHDFAPKGMLTVSSSIEDFKIFGEAVVSYGSDKTFIDDPGAFPYTLAFPPLIPVEGFGAKPTTKTIDDEFIFSGTIGTMYMNSDWDFTFISQYYFNGEGYNKTETDEKLASSIFMATPTDKNGLGMLSLGDVFNFGQHYVTAIAMWKELFETDFGFTTLASMNLTDISGMISSTISYKFFDYASIEGGMTFIVGEDGGEYTSGFMNFNQASLSPRRMTFDITLKLGVSSF